ncbi:MAG: hypothetical protein ABS69_07315 [Nitrosomonadales bacterium SCN 54-20]|nr:MAG: hypothetical protein ABS69_07315 [Nitrosomonadales bacterium SCN 54-20]
MGAFWFKIKHPAASSGVLTALLQFAGFQPAFAPGGELNPKRLNFYRGLLGQLPIIIFFGLRGRNMRYGCNRR